MNRWPKAGFVIAAVFIGAQGARSVPTNPPIDRDLSVPPQVKAILRRACYDCHSNETQWPWYSRIAPLSWLIRREVNRGRARLNFSEWSEYASDPGTASEKLEKIAQAVTRGDMAPWYYQVLHPCARLTMAQRDTLHAWVTQEALALPPSR